MQSHVPRSPQQVKNSRNQEKIVNTIQFPETLGNVGTLLLFKKYAYGERETGGAGGIKTVKDAKAAGLQKGFKDLDDWQWQELYQTGLALEQAVQERIEGLAGEALGNDKLRWLQQGFFKTNLLFSLSISLTLNPINSTNACPAAVSHSIVGANRG